MSSRPDWIRVCDLIASAREGMLDVPEFHRAFNRDQNWTRDLVDSLARGIPAGSLLLWAPAVSPPASGRYRADSDASWWIVDGHQRITALLVAFGIDPPWIPAGHWAATAGSDPPVMLAARPDGRIMVTGRGLPGPAPQVSLAEAYAAYGNGTLPGVLIPAGFRDDDQPLEFERLLRAVLDTELPLEWLSGTLEDAFLAFTRRNSSRPARPDGHGAEAGPRRSPAGLR